jgi:hypothetical protein
MGEKTQFKRNERVQFQMEQEQMRRNQEEYSRKEILREQEYKDKFKKFDQKLAQNQKVYQRDVVEPKAKMLADEGLAMLRAQESVNTKAQKDDFIKQ